MKKFLYLLLIFLTIGCNNLSNSKNDLSTNSSSISLNDSIPTKHNIYGTAIEDSSINTKNIDNFMFRDDVIYVDLRFYSWVIKDGYIAGFSFFSFYEFIATKEGTTSDGETLVNRLFKMKNERGMLGEVGNFEPNYVESEQMLNDLFPKNKYIFAISQSGQESRYFLNLLIQYNYDASKLYNIGGFKIGTGFENKAYINIENPRYLVNGNPLIDSSLQNNTLNFMKDLTPIE